MFWLEQGLPASLRPGARPRTTLSPALALRDGRTTTVPVAVLAAGVVSAPLLLSGLWEGIVAKGLAFAIIFLSYTLVSGSGGMLSLCQISFAGIAAALTADLATNHGVAIVVAIWLVATTGVNATHAAPSPNCCATS